MAAVEIGAYPDMGACADAWITPALGEATAPDPELTELYGALYEVYRTTREAMPPAWERLARIRQERLG
jgi:erythritol kinase